VKKYWPFCLLVLVSVSFIFFFYGKPLLHPDDYFFNDRGDAIKNYFTLADYVKHNGSLTNFEGMNYPYGEHILYTDCHPVIAVLLKSLASGFPCFSDHSIGILNFLMIISVFLTFFACYFLLKEFGVNRWLSLLFSIGMTLLAPQIFRLGGHFALSYSVAIPLSWLLLVKSLKNKGKQVFPAILFFNNLFWLFIHAYLGVIIFSFQVLISIIHYFSDRERRKKTAQYLIILAAIILPVIAFNLFAGLTDTHSGRTGNPSGFFLYNAEPDDVFLPHHPPLRPLLDEITGHVINQEWEAWSYVGLSTTVLFIILIGLLVIRIFKKGKTILPDSSFNDKILNISLLAAFIVLLFAMAFPLRQFPVLADIFPVIKQFRATGRFAWPFYFISLVFAAKVMQDIYQRSAIKGKNVSGISLCLVVGLFNITEGVFYHVEVSRSIVKSANLFNKELLPVSYSSAIKTVNSWDYQAIIALPFYYQGSETYSRPRNDNSVRASLVISYHTGIPVVCADLTRTSVEESKKIVQIVSPGFYKKKIQSDLPDNRPFLVIRTKDPLTGYEEDIFRRCTPVHVDEDISLYSVTREELCRNTGHEIYDNYQSVRPTLRGFRGFEMTKDSSFLYYDSFEGSRSAKPFRGNGGFESLKKGKNILAEFQPGTFAPGKDYQVSIWMYNGMKDALNDWFRLIIEEYDEDENSFLTTACFPEQSEVINGDWSLVEISFRISDPRNKIFIVTKGKDDSKGPFYADDLLIRENGADVYRLNQSRDTLFFNNHEIIIK
jgi:hypothetical protein